MTFDVQYLAERLAHTGLCVEFVHSIPSTSGELFLRAHAGITTPTLLVAGSQSAGRGRMDRSFFSPAGCGVYFSLLLPPARESDPTRITAVAALAAAEAAEALGAPPCSIKWVNDVYAREKKCCGILTYGVFSGGTLSSLVVGVGANLTPPEGGFPAEIADRAGAFFEQSRPLLREDFVAETTLRIPEMLKHKFPIDSYRARSCVLGRRVEVVRADESFFATALEIDSDCRLLVRADDGELHTLFSGEVSLVL